MTQTFGLIILQEVAQANYEHRIRTLVICIQEGMKNLQRQQEMRSRTNTIKVRQMG